MSRVRCAGVGSGVLLLLLAVAVWGADRPGPSAVVGRWDIAVQGPQGEYPSWLEVRKSGATLVGSFVGKVGSARPISRVELDDGRLHFTVPPQYEERKDDLTFDGRLEGDVLRGETTDDQGHRIPWTARRAPS